MSDGKLFVKSKSSEIKAELDQAYKRGKPHAKIKLILKKVTANIILNNNEISKLLPDMINLLRFDDLEIRRVCLDFLCFYSHYDPKTALNAVPFLKRFREDSDSILRALTIKTLTSIELPEFTDLSFSVIKLYLKDPNVYVRIAAAYSTARLFKFSTSRVINENLIDSLNDLLYDEDDTVISVALSALDSIIEHDKTLDLKLTVNPSHSIKLLKTLHRTTEWSQVYILNSLLSFVPQHTNTALDLIELVIPFLQHENSSIVLNAVKVIVYLSNYVKDPELILPSLPKRLGSSLVSLLSKPPELQFLVLRNIILLLLGRKYLVQFDVEMLFCKYDDTIYVKDTKLEIIYLLANEHNFSTVTRELEEYATDVDVAMARKAIRAFGNLAIKITSAASLCVEIIIDLISNKVSYIVQEAVVVIKNIVRRYPGDFDYAITEMAKYYKLMEESDAKAAMIWMYGQYHHLIEDIEEGYTTLIQSYKDEPLEVQLATLTATTKLYLHYPEKFERSVLAVLKWATEEVNNPDIRERGFFYWRLISSESGSDVNGGFQSVAKQVVFNENPRIDSENENINPAVLEELELNIGTLASIYLKPIALVFRLSKSRTLPHSQALQPRRPSKNSADNSARSSRATSTDNLALPEEGKIYSSRKFNVSADAISRKKSIIRQSSFDSTPSGLSDDSKKNGLARRLSKRASILTGRRSSK
ncbi:hypothetical protein PSN45_001771 [Yamadazyma tenuis]|uniref:AP complex subunit beta n=1 Tax=Candida tenuis (strain ATCC 10573 / BCRC 21748 / CBS 615 / JCM 9827 / NBRC 10315 / NRRL Y-1498 / VKM Y-70) TaxID=590646 RepID=G3BE69_CANTC|nr:uncharacterized protein CANTEDRAFT_111853 [Yamadazyma tenuis ATCC 10573]EGV60473.1 hypothetical protein CANTEDRAFT_111853 [Yamadazyma tenuis ATCC 10573]WEJ94287.1 hypothetical protein PSN45_001771 [Yamadazyma tenuis]